MSENSQTRPTPVVPDYEILRCIGRGAYGEVWLCRNMLGKLRAVKVIYRDAFDSDEPYLREFAGIRQFEPVSGHHSQVRIYHIGQNAQEYYFYYVMDLADDASWSARQQNEALQESGAIHDGYVPATLSLRLLEEGRLRLAECLDIAAGLASALQHLHENGLVHRDIKPANVVFVNGCPKLADIGLVANTTNASTFIGTSGYIPPEGPGSPQADIYSFGKLLYEIATGRDRRDFPQLPENFAGSPDHKTLLELNEVILKACQNDPSQRYTSAAEMLADIDRLRHGQSLRSLHLRKKLVRAALAVLCIALVTSVGFGWRAFKSGRAVAPLSVPPPAGLIAWWPGDGNAKDVVGGHDGNPVNGAGHEAGFIGKAFRVNGKNQYFSIPHTAELSFTNGQPFTVEAWVYRRPGKLPFHVLGKREHSQGCYYQMGFDYGTPAVPINQWTHIVICYDGNQQLWYYNGALVLSTRQHCSGPNMADFQIGASHGYTGFDGLIDDVRIYGRVLASEEIKAITAVGTNGMRRPTEKESGRKLL